MKGNIMNVRRQPTTAEEWLFEHSPNYENRRFLTRVIAETYLFGSAAFGPYFARRYEGGLTIEGPGWDLTLTNLDDLDALLDAICWLDHAEERLNRLPYGEEDVHG
jgi:hypothetical protein